jgi:hypothetical protein
MHEISPVLAGKYDSPDYTPAVSNINNSSSAVSDTSSTSNVDPRRYTRFDRTASQVASSDMSFGDVMDMINPLQHIPVVSSVYRAVTGDKINPISRVAGDILYGGALGVASAIGGGVSAVADSVMEAKSGKDVTGTVLASLFGDEKDQAGDSTVQVASAATTSATVPAAQAQQVAANAAAATTAVPTTAANATTAPAAQDGVTQVAQGYPLVRNKMPYGGAMAPVKSMQEQNMAMALASGPGGVRVGNTLYPNRLVNGVRTLNPAVPTGPAATTAVASATTPAPIANTATSSTSSSSSSDLQSLLATAMAPSTPNATPVPTGQQTLMSTNAAATSISPSSDATTPTSTAGVATSTPAVANTQLAVPPNLQDDLLVLKALGLYKNVAGSNLGSTSSKTVDQRN